MLDRVEAKARARKIGPKKSVSMFARMSASVTSNKLALGRIAPALLINTETSDATEAAAAMDAGSITSRMRGTMRSSRRARGVRAVASMTQIISECSQKVRG